MTPEELEHVLNIVRSTIKDTVNGKIDRLTHTVEKQGDTFNAYIEKDEEWKKTAQPVIDLGTDLTGFGKVTVYALGVCATLLGIGYTIYRIVLGK